MATIQHSIEVKLPVHHVYSRLTHFEEYPRFMEDVETVQRIDTTHLHWTTRMANRPVEWEAEITEQEPDRCIAWHNTSGPTNAGKVELEALDANTSRVTFTLLTQPEQVPGSLDGFHEQELAQRLQQDLTRLKQLIETPGSGIVDDGMRAGQPNSGARQPAATRQKEPAAPPIPMRHLGQLPQDTTAEEHGGVPTSDAMGKSIPPTEQAAIAVTSQIPTPNQKGAEMDTENQSSTNDRSSSSAPPTAAPATAGTSAVAGAAGGTDASAGAHFSGSKGGPGGNGLRQEADAAGVPGTPGGMMQGDMTSAAAGAAAAGGTGLGQAATADDTRTGTGTSSTSGTALTGGGASGARDAGIAPGKTSTTKP